jgi:hypothetical protein
VFRIDRAYGRAIGLLARNSTMATPAIAPFVWDGWPPLSPD